MIASLTVLLICQLVGEILARAAGIAWLLGAVNEIAGAFSSLAMGLKALATAVLVPVLLALLT